MRGIGAGLSLDGDLQRVLGSPVTLYPNPVATAQGLAAGRLEVGTESFTIAQYDQKKGSHASIKIMPMEPDPGGAASVQPGQTAFPYAKSNQALDDALYADIADQHKSGNISRILKAHVWTLRPPMLANLDGLSNACLPASRRNHGQPGQGNCFGSRCDGLACSRDLWAVLCAFPGSPSNSSV